jgi:hypothetical protein
MALIGFVFKTQNRWSRDPLGGPYRLESLELVESFRTGSGQRGFIAPEIGEGIRIHSERPCRYD